ncbi:hypothetical protein STEG23_003065, partial [Scotinomys teguina]
MAMQDKVGGSNNLRKKGIVKADANHLPKEQDAKGLEACLFSDERQKGVGTRWKRRFVLPPWELIVEIL